MTDLTKQSFKHTFSNGNLFFPIEARVNLCDPTRTKLLVRTAFGPPGLAITGNSRTNVIKILLIKAFDAKVNLQLTRCLQVALL